jgi:hypothetical protein
VALIGAALVRGLPLAVGALRVVEDEPLRAADVRRPGLGAGSAWRSAAPERGRSPCWRCRTRRSSSTPPSAPTLAAGALVIAAPAGTLTAGLAGAA